MPFEEFRINVANYPIYHSSSNSSNCDDSQRGGCLLKNSRIIVLICLFSSFPPRDHNYSNFSTSSERGGCRLGNFRFLFVLIVLLLTFVLIFVVTPKGTGAFREIQDLFC